MANLSAFDRLYYSGLQRKASRERKVQLFLEEKNQLEKSQL